MTNDLILPRTALVLGATGGIGGHVARGLFARGWTVRALSRGASTGRQLDPRFQWHRGDALNAEDVRRAAEGAELIVHGVNPPGYRDWEKLVLPMLDNTISAARAVGARILLPGTVYNYGPDVFPVITEESPQNALTRKGKIRVEMERRLQAAATSGVAVLIVRAGDFFGPGAGNSWFSQGVIKPGKPVTTFSNPGKGGIGHQWAYLPDVAETMLRLVDRSRDLPVFALFHMQGVWDHDGQQMRLAIERVQGRSVKESPLPWWLLRLAAPFVPMFRELGEMRYLWRTPVRMTNDKLADFLGVEPCTPLDVAMRATLTDLGCLDADAGHGDLAGQRDTGRAA
ncbi:MAG: NAD-dependent epimerase/dehydratase family protein [Pseudorhizobium sp.]